MQFKIATIALIATFFTAGQGALWGTKGPRFSQTHTAQHAPTAGIESPEIDAAVTTGTTNEPVFWQAPFADATPNPAVGVLTKRRDHCGASTFENRGSGGSPFVSDCEQIIRNLSGDGSWPLSFEPHKEIARYGSCHFGIEWGQLHRGTVMVGTSDVKDLIRDSISKFRRSDGRVGSRGIMPCGPDDIAIVWGLY